MADHPNIPVLMTTAFSKPWSAGGGAQVYAGTSNYTSFQYAQGSSCIYFLVLDRSNPSAAPVFKGTAPNSTTPPSGLDAFLNENYLLFVLASTFVTQVPQGNLYTMLLNNGGGSELRKIELMTTKFACGTSAGLTYMLASVPGSGLPGIEFQTNRISASTYDGSALSVDVGSYFLMVELVADATGKYVPLRVGT